MPAGCSRGIEIIHEAIHETADGKRLLVLHGDRSTASSPMPNGWPMLGDWAYGVALRAERRAVRGAQGARPALLVAVGLAQAQGQERGRIYLAASRKPWRAKPRARGVDGVVCGHIHHAEIRTIGGVLYLNDGDWVESCTALVEDARGHLEILRWASLASRTCAWLVRIAGEAPRPYRA